MAGLVGRMLTRFILRPRVRKLTWDQLLKGAIVSAERFDESIAGVNEEASAISAGGYMSVRDSLAHLTAANESVAAQLEAFRAAAPGAGVQTDLYVVAGEHTLFQLREAHRRSVDQLAQAAARPITGDALAEHEMFGPIGAAEWLATVAMHYEYHARQITRIMRSEAYLRAQGASW